MTCTDCNKTTNHVHTDRWNQVYGQIINPDEELCTECAEQQQQEVDDFYCLEEEDKTKCEIQCPFCERV